MQEPFTIHFTTGSVATAIRPAINANLKDVLHQLQLWESRPVLVIVGGASRLSSQDMEQLRSLFVEVLAPLAEQLNAYVVDGGTEAGVMQMMGVARQQTGGSFPLIGVAPIGMAILPDVPAESKDGAALEPHHTHFVLAPGSQWGDEVPWIAQVASQLANGAPSVTVLINGGEVTWQDALQSVHEGRPIIVVAGSGRTADVIVSALSGQVTDERARALVASGLLEAVAMENSGALENAVRNHLWTGKPARSGFVPPVSC